MPGAADVLKQKLGRRPRLGPAQDRPLAVVEVEDRVDRNEVHVRVVEGIDRSDVTPVTVLPLAHSRHHVGGEVVDLSFAAIDERRNQVAADVVARGLVCSVDRDCVDEHVSAEHVVAHRGEDLVGRVGEPGGVAGLLAERADRPPVVSGLDHAELARLLDRHPDAGHGHAGSARDVLVDHLARIHPVDVVGAEDADVVRLLVVQEVEVLVDRVGRAANQCGPWRICAGTAVT